MSTVDAQLEHARPERVLVLAPLGRDAEVICQVLSSYAVDAAICTDMQELAGQVHAAGAAVLTEEALTAATAVLLDAVRAQPSWSDVPILVLISRKSRAGRTTEALNALLSATNVVVLERPALGISLLTAVQAALRSRRRQYQQRDLMRSEQLARRDAQAALRSRDDFLATLSHELRTPLNAIVLWTKLMQAENRDPRTLVQGLPAVVRSADALSKLIEDLLDMARMIAGTLRIERRPLSLDDELRAAVDVVRPLAEAKAIQLEASFGTNVVVQADPDRLQQSVWNLLTNAIKFTPRGGRVTIRSSCQDSHARIEVADTGKGIGAEFLSHVFEHFRQAEATTKRLEGGLGLGLAITRQLVHLHGGTIRVESEGEGKGARFTIELPIERPASSSAVDSAAPASADALSGVRVLLVEDHRSTREALAATLQAHGARAFSTETAESALELLATATEAGRAPQVLLIDLGLRAMDGFGLLQQIRVAEHSRNAAQLPAALITGYVSSDSRERALAGGFQAYLPKPVDPKRLVAVVRELADSQQLAGHSWS